MTSPGPDALGFVASARRQRAAGTQDTGVRGIAGVRAAYAPVSSLPGEGSTLRPCAGPTGALTGSLGLTSPLQKWQKKRCAATVEPASAPAAEASAMFRLRRECPKGRPAVSSQAATFRAAVAAVAASSVPPVAPGPARVT